MIIVWRGWGILAPVIVIAALVAVLGAVGAAHLGLLGQRIALGVAGMGAAGGIWALARWLEHGKASETFVNEATGRRVTVPGGDAGSFFFIPTRIWPWIVSGLGVFLALTGAAGDLAAP